MGSGCGTILCFQKSYVFVNCGSADVADPCEFRHIQLLALVCGAVPKEVGGDVFFAHLRSPDLPTFYKKADNEYISDLDFIFGDQTICSHNAKQSGRKSAPFVLSINNQT